MNLLALVKAEDGKIEVIKDRIQAIRRVGRIDQIILYNYEGYVLVLNVYSNGYAFWIRRYPESLHVYKEAYLLGVETFDLLMFERSTIETGAISDYIITEGELTSVIKSIMKHGAIAEGEWLL